jgi:cytochrome c
VEPSDREPRNAAPVKGCHHASRRAPACPDVEPEGNSMFDTKRRARRFALIPALLLLSACDQYAEVKSGLSPEEAARFERGQSLATPCWSCHDITGHTTKVGPSLAGLFGRRAGTHPDFSYSPAFASASLVWSARSLDAFLADGQRVVPENRMVSPGVSGSRQRADLVFFLELVTRPR